jgi:hypothetical protein
MANGNAQSAIRRYLPQETTSIFEDVPATADAYAGRRAAWGERVAVGICVFSRIEGGHQQNANNHSDGGRERKKYYSRHLIRKNNDGRDPF